MLDFSIILLAVFRWHIIFEHSNTLPWWNDVNLLLKFTCQLRKSNTLIFVYIFINVNDHLVVLVPVSTTRGRTPVLQSQLCYRNLNFGAFTHPRVRIRRATSGILMGPWESVVDDWPLFVFQVRVKCWEIASLSVAVAQHPRAMEIVCN